MGKGSMPVDVILPRDLDKLKDWKWPYQRINFGGDKEYSCPHEIGHGGLHGCDGCPCDKIAKPLRQQLCYSCYETHRAGGRSFKGHTYKDGCCNHPSFKKETK